MRRDFPAAPATWKLLVRPRRKLGNDRILFSLSVFRRWVTDVGGAVNASMELDGSLPAVDTPVARDPTPQARAEKLQPTGTALLPELRCRSNRKALNKSILDFSAHGIPNARFPDAFILGTFRVPKSGRASCPAGDADLIRVSPESRFADGEIRLVEGKMPRLVVAVRGAEGALKREDDEGARACIRTRYVLQSSFQS